MGFADLSEVVRLNSSSPLMLFSFFKHLWCWFQKSETLYLVQ